MIYGLYLSATGVRASSQNIDVLANNLANSETVGFKRDLTLFRQRLTAKEETNQAGDWSDPVQEGIGGGMYLNPTLIDSQQGELEQTGNPLDVGIQGDGYLAVKKGDAVHLSRDGKMMVNQNGELVLANSSGARVLNAQQQPIVLQPGLPASIGSDGSITQGGNTVGQIGLFNVSDPTKLVKQGANLLDLPSDQSLAAGTGTFHSGYIERSNVDPASELAQLMAAQRQLEANANMIHYQDETLQQLVQDVGKIS
jgi:flagellar basal body rod protein FlgG